MTTRETKDTSLIVTAETLAEAIVKATELASGNKRKIPYGQDKGATTFNPEGKRDRKIRHVIYQNGYRLFEHQLTDPEIDLLNSGKIKPGLYIDKLVHVVAVDMDDTEPDLGALHFNYRNKTADQRMALGSKLGGGGGTTGFERMLRLIVTEIEERAAQEKQRRKTEIEEALA